ncbi:hypothetical protein HDU93_007388, partial [Gonapodya sp. JEL0774]
LLVAGVLASARSDSKYVVINLDHLDKRPVQLGNPTMSWTRAWNKAQRLLRNLTLEDKADIVTGVGWMKGPCVGNIAAKPAIGFKGLCLQDSPTGVRFADLASAFPAPINLAATFDKKLMFRQGVLMGQEHRNKGVNVALAPCMNIMRAPEGGRSWEAYGPDPVLASVASHLTVQGIQSQGVIATAKHFILNEQEHNRNFESSVVGLRALHEVYLRPFKSSITAGVGAIMCSYNKVNGTWACENPELYTILKDELGFRGFVMTDWWAAHSGALTATAGVDMMMPGSVSIASEESYWGANLVEHVKAGRVPESRLDDMVTRVLAAWIKMGQDKEGFPDVNFDSWDPDRGQHVDVLGDHGRFIRAAGAASAVLVKNSERVLPLSNSTVAKIAVVGEDAFGPAKGINSCADHGCVDGTVAQGWGSGTTNFPYIVSPVEGVATRAEERGMQVVATREPAEALRVAEKAQVAIVFVFADSGEEYISVEGNQGDRNDLSLWRGENSLVTAVAAVQKTVVVVHSPGPVLVPWIDHPNVTAVIFAGMPGQETGNAIADVLFGDVNPSGRLPYTVAASRWDYPANVQETSLDIHYDEGILVDYRWFEATGVSPVYPFGHGLSYSTFAYSPVVVDPPTSVRKSYRVSLNVTNTGTRDGHEVVQLYLALPSSTCQAQGCAKELRDFDRVWIEAGKTLLVRLHLYRDDMAMYDVTERKWVVPRGEFRIFVGASSTDVRGGGSILL